MWRASKAIRAVVVVLTTLATAVAVLAAGLAWRLSRAPIALDWLRPRLEAALQPGPEGPSIRLGATVLAWSDGGPEVRVSDVRVRSADGTEVSVAAAAVGLAVDGLLRGAVGVTSITLVGARLELVRQADWTIAPGDAASPASRLTAALHAGTFSGLTEVRVRDGRLELRDPDLGAVWQADDLSLRVWRSEDGLALEGAFRLTGGPRPVPVVARGTWPTTATGPVVQLGVRGLDPALLAPSLGGLTLPVDAVATVAFDASLQLERAVLRLRAGPGRVAWPGDAVVLEQGKIGAAVLVQEGRADVERVRLRFADGIQAVGRARLTDLNGALAVQAWLTVPAAPVSDLLAHWPPSVANAARRWVLRNIRGGSARDLAIRVRGGRGGLDDVDASLRFAGLTVRALDALPPLVAVRGSLRLANGALQAEVASARLSDLAVEPARVTIGSVPPALAVDAQVRGPLGSALLLLERPPFGLAGALGVPATAVRGTVAGRVGLGFRLDRPPTGLADAGLTVSATVRDLDVPHAVAGRSLTGGPVRLTLGGTRLSAAGEVRVAGVPLRATLDEGLRDEGSRRIAVSGRLDREARVALGFDPGNWLEGPVVADLQMAGPSADLRVDLREASLSLPGLAKATGLPGEATAHLGFREEQIPCVERFAVTVPDATLRGSVRRTPDGRRWAGVDARLQPVPAGPGGATLVVSPGPDPQRFVLQSADAGALIRRLGARTDARGGRLTVTGTVGLEAPGVPADATLEVADVTLREAPVLARIVTLASLTGLARALQGKGLRFSRISAGLGIRWPVVTVSDGLADGPEVALQLAGDLDLGADALELRGTVVPSYFGLNTAADRLPILGPVVQAVTGGALQAVDFRVRGPLTAPDVTVSPLSALAPGRLRDLVRSWER